MFRNLFRKKSKKDIYRFTEGYSPHFQKNRYNNCFEYMFVFSKGTPSTFNLLREPRTTKGNRTGTLRLKDGTLKKEERKLNKTRVLKNIWHIDTGYMRTTKDKIAYKHPAIFPEKLAKWGFFTAVYLALPCESPYTASS